MVLFALANAAEIQVQASRPIVVAVDGVAVGVGGTVIDTVDLEPGTHRVQVRNFVGSLLAEGEFTLAADERLRLLYDRDRRALIVLDTSRAEPVPVPGPAPAPAPAPAVAKGAPRPAPTVALTDSPTGSLVITGLSDLSGAVSAAGTDLPFDPAAGGFLALELSPPEVQVRVTDNGIVRHEGPVTVVAGGERVCELLFRETAWVLDCVTSRPYPRPSPDADPLGTR